MRKGKIILIPFPFTDLSGHKVRPALVLHASKKQKDVLACFISSQKIGRLHPFDLKIKADMQNGLKVDSIIKIQKIATLEKRLAIGEIGHLENKILKEVDSKLKILFSLYLPL